MDKPHPPDIERCIQGVRALECVCDLVAGSDDLHLVSSSEICALLRIIIEHICSGLPPG